MFKLMQHRSSYSFLLLVLLIFIASVGWGRYLAVVSVPKSNSVWSPLPELPEPAAHIWGFVEQGPRTKGPISSGLMVEGESGTLYYLWNPDPSNLRWLIYDGSVDDLKFSFLSLCHGRFEVPYIAAIEYYERAGCGEYWNWQESYAITGDGAVWEWNDKLNITEQGFRGFALSSVAPVVATLLIAYLLWRVYYRRSVVTENQKAAK
jgi:hypothetical protein